MDKLNIPQDIADLLDNYRLTLQKELQIGNITRQQAFERLLRIALKPEYTNGTN